MSWYSKPRWEKESSEKDWREREWKGQGSEWSEWPKTKGERKSGWSEGDWHKSDKSKGYDWKNSDWKKHDWKNSQKTGDTNYTSTSLNQTYQSASSPAQISQVGHRPSQWVAKNSRSHQGQQPKQRFQAVGPASCSVEDIHPVDPVVALESSLTDIEDLLGEKLHSTRALLENSEQNSREAVSLATVALELLCQKTAGTVDVRE